MSDFETIKIIKFTWKNFKCRIFLEDWFTRLQKISYKWRVYNSTRICGLIHFLSNCAIASLDFVSLFTSILISYSCEFNQRIWQKYSVERNLDILDIIELLRFCLTSKCLIKNRQNSGAIFWTENNFTFALQDLFLEKICWRRFSYCQTRIFNWNFVKS